MRKAKIFFKMLASIAHLPVFRLHYHDYKTKYKAIFFSAIQYKKLLI